MKEQGKIRQKQRKPNDARRVFFLDNKIVYLDGRIDEPRPPSERRDARGLPRCPTPAHVGDSAIRRFLELLSFLKVPHALASVRVERIGDAIRPRNGLERCATSGLGRVGRKRDFQRDGPCPAADDAKMKKPHRKSLARLGWGVGLMRQNEVQPRFSFAGGDRFAVPSVLRHLDDFLGQHIHDFHRHFRVGAGQC